MADRDGYVQLLTTNIIIPKEALERLAGPFMAEPAAQRVMDEAADTITRLTAEVEQTRMREACAADLAREWESHCKTAEAEVEKLRDLLSGVLWMAEEWFNHGGDETTFADEYEAKLEAARAELEVKG